MSVVCLEQGEWPDRAAYRGGHLDWELTSRKQWFWDPNARRLPQDFTVDMSESDVPTLGTYSGVGGSATLFNGVWPRLTPANFRSRSLSGYGDENLLPEDLRGRPRQNHLHDDHGRLRLLPLLQAHLVLRSQQSE
jgi:choline dehydrogenase-like flavoprotein